MEHKTEIVLIEGTTATGKTMLAWLLMAEYEKRQVTALLVESDHIKSDALQHLYDSGHFKHIVVTRTTGSSLKPPCLEKPFQTITISLS